MASTATLEGYIKRKGISPSLAASVARNPAIVKAEPKPPTAARKQIMEAEEERKARGPNPALNGYEIYSLFYEANKESEDEAGRPNWEDDEIMKKDITRAAKWYLKKKMDEELFPTYGPDEKMPNEIVSPFLNKIIIKDDELMNYNKVFAAGIHHNIARDTLITSRRKQKQRIAAARTESESSIEAEPLVRPKLPIKKKAFE